jgi:hypothetical protein
VRLKIDRYSENSPLLVKPKKKYPISCQIRDKDGGVERLL